MFLTDLLLVTSNVNFADYADDSTIYQYLLHQYKNETISDNETKGKTDSCCFITSANKSFQIYVGDPSIESSRCEKLLKVKIDSKLNLNDYVKYSYNSCIFYIQLDQLRKIKRTNSRLKRNIKML